MNARLHPAVVATTLTASVLLSGCPLLCMDCGEGCRIEITRDLEPVTVQEGEPATFSVTARGTGDCDLRYAWSRDGRPIAAADGPRHTTAATTLQDDGSLFSVNVNSFGLNPSADSARVRLTVLPASPASAAAH